MKAAMTMFVRVVWTLVKLAIPVSLIVAGFALMNQPSTLAFWGGFTLAVATVCAWSTWLLQSKPLVLVLLVAVAASNCTRVEAGYTGIKINYAGTYRGAKDVPSVSGWVFYTPLASTVFQYPSFVQTVKWTEADEAGSPANEHMVFNSKEGMTLGADISLSYQLDPTKVPAFYVQFRSDDLGTFTHGFLHNTARDAFNEIAPNYNVDELYGPKKEELVTKVRERINKETTPIGVKIVQFGFIGKMKLPQSVEAALNMKIQATQDAIRVENEVRKATAEAQKNIASAEGNARAQIASAEGQAKSNDIVAASIARNPQILEWERLKIQGRWNGVMPTVVSNGQSLLNIPVGK